MTRTQHLKRLRDAQNAVWLQDAVVKAVAAELEAESAKLRVLQAAVRRLNCPAPRPLSAPKPEPVSVNAAAEWETVLRPYLQRSDGALSVGYCLDRLGVPRSPRNQHAENEVRRILREYGWRPQREGRWTHCSPDRDAAIVDAYVKGASLRVLAERYDVSHERIRQIIRKHGVKSRPVGNAWSPKASVFARRRAP